MPAATFVGKLCAKHPETGGLRYVAQKVCVECLRETNRERREAKRQWAERNRDSVRANAAVYRARNRERLAQYSRDMYAARYKEKKAEYRKKNAAAHAEYHAEYRNGRRSRYRQLSMQHYQQNKADYIFRARVREQHVSRFATPAWADKEEIRRIYANCPPGYSVDHVVPLRGELVSGLHVPLNLQYLPAADNKAKGNKFEVV